MKINHMKEVAKILGVEFDKEFEIDCTNHKIITAKLNSSGIRVIDTNFADAFNMHPGIILESLLSGNCTIKRKPWKPQHRHDTYFFVYSDGTIGQGSWTDREWDKMNYKLGNCYPNQKSAEEDREKWRKFYASDEVLDI